MYHSTLGVSPAIFVSHKKHLQHPFLCFVLRFYNLLYTLFLLNGHTHQLVYFVINLYVFSSVTTKPKPCVFQSFLTQIQRFDNLCLETFLFLESLCEETFSAVVPFCIFHCWSSFLYFFTESNSFGFICSVFFLRLF